MRTMVLCFTLFFAALSAQATTLELDPNKIEFGTGRSIDELCKQGSTYRYPRLIIQYGGREIYNNEFIVGGEAACNRALIKAQTTVEKAKQSPDGVVLFFAENKPEDWNWILATNKVTADEIMKRFSELEEKTNNRLKRLELRVFGE